MSRKAVLLKPNAVPAMLLLTHQDLHKTNIESLLLLERLLLMRKLKLKKLENLEKDQKEKLKKTQSVLPITLEPIQLPNYHLSVSLAQR